jgi:hypothetical protein
LIIVSRHYPPALSFRELISITSDYPELDGDQARRGIWIHDVPLQRTHSLRNELNSSKVDYLSVLEKYDMDVIASVLKLYLLELPGMYIREGLLTSMLTARVDSLVSSQVYEIVKTIYSTTAQETSEEGRIKVLQSTLGQLRLNNIATLDAMMTHFTRMIDLTSADDSYVFVLAQALSPCILRPRTESSLTMDERHSYRLIRDLFSHKEAIFGELKRQSSAFGMGSGSNRPRAISTDESNRRAAMEARSRAIVDRSRANSPAPPRKHRRDRSSGASESGRFPINVASPPERRNVSRNSLDVPSSNDSATGAEPSVNTQVTDFVTNGTPIESPASGADSASNSGTTSPPPPAAGSDGSPTPTPTPVPVPGTTGDPEKRSSIPRSGARVQRKPGLGSRSSFPTDIQTENSTTDSKRNSVVEDEPKGVTLEDKPMDD